MLPPFARRRFLQLAGVALAGCGDDETHGASSPSSSGAGGTGGGPPATTDVPFGVWKEMRDAIRLSPDHLVAEAERVVATKDPQKIFELVRDRFATIPAALDDFGSANRRLFGLRGTLRAGAGSLRDKAELLVDLYQRAGFEASVMKGTPASDPAWIDKVLVRTVDRPFSPQVTDEQVARWRELLGMPAEPPATEPLDPTGSNAQGLAADLLALLPADLAVAPFTMVPYVIPLVGVMVDGELKHANVALPDAVFGDAGTTGAPGPADTPDPMAKVTLSLSMVTTRSPKDPIEIVKAEIGVDDLVGRSLHVMMVPPDELAALLVTPLDKLETFLPVLAVRSPDLVEADLDAHTFVGSALTRSGNVLAIAPSGEVSIDGTPVDTSPLDPAKVASVASLVLEVGASEFASIALRVRALDSAGNSVEGLAASAFALEEDGASLGFKLLENKAPPPRIVFSMDKSTSMPPQYQGAGAAQLCKDLAAALLASDATCTFRVLSKDAASGDWLTSAQQVYDAVLAEAGYGSDIWSGLAAAAKLAGHTVVMISDGDASDTKTPKVAGAIALCPPAVLVSATGTSGPAFDQMATDTGGVVVAVTSTAQIVSNALAFVAERRKSAYLLSYTAPDSGLATRQISLSLNGSSASASGSYVVPAPDAITPPLRIGGLLLAIQVGSEPVVTRVLAGRLELDDGTPESVFEEVRQAFVGTVEARFEGAPPTPSHILDDLLTARLGLEPFWTAVKDGDAEAALDAMLRTPVSHSADGFALHGAIPPPAGASLHPTGLRAVLRTFTPIDPTHAGVRVDVVPMGSHRVPSADGREGLTGAFGATARIALVEDAFFEQSTRSALAGATLVPLAPFQSIGSAVPGLSADLIARWDRAMRGLTNAHRLVPSTGTPVAFWHVDPKTGALLGMLENGSGGAQGTVQWAKGANSALDIMERAASASGAMGTAAGTWFALEVTKARKLIAATVVIAGFDPPGGVPDLTDLACQAASGGANLATGGGPPWLTQLGQLGMAAHNAVNAASTSTEHSSIC